MNKLILSFLLIFNLLPLVSRAQDCSITAVNAVALPCTGFTFLVSVNLEVVNPASPGFTLAGNGVIYGTFLYDELPVVVGPLLGDDEAVYEFIAWDVENANCQQYTTMPAANCGPICSFTNFELNLIQCISNQSALVEFDFDYQNPPGPTFQLFNGEGEFLSAWLYSSLPVSLPAFVVNGAAPIVLTVCDPANSACCETFVLDAIDCNPNNCEIFSVNIDPQCTGSNFLVHLDFEIDNTPSDSFTVVGNSLNYGTFAYSQRPITLGPLNGSSNIQWEFHIADRQMISCNTTAVLGIYTCPPPCDVLAMEALALECDGNEYYALMIGLDIEGEGDSGFSVFSETTYYGTYSYNNLPIIIPSFESTCQLVDMVSVCDNENITCCATIPFETLLCCGCLIYNISAVPLPCNDQNQIYVQINFSHQNVSDQGFEISGNGTNYGEFAYEDLPILLGPFEGDGSQYFEFVINDLVQTLCFGAVELGYISCPDICELTNLTVDIGQCNGHHSFPVVIDFDVAGETSAGFLLYINDVLYDDFNYNQLPLTIEHFPTSATGVDVVSVCDASNDLCCDTLEFAAPVCECHIFDAHVSEAVCISDEAFTVTLDFFYENLPGNLVDISLDGILLGTIHVGQLPLLVTIPEGDGTSVLTVCANDLETCCDEVIIELMQCEIPVCHIGELVAEVGHCTSESTYVLDVVFNGQHLPTDSVLIYANGILVGQYLIQPDFIRIENFPISAEEMTLLEVCAVGDPECCSQFTFTTPDCTCSIQDLVTDTGHCTSDSTYILHVVFDYQNLPTDSVIITANGNTIGQFQVHEGHIILEHFPLYATAETMITVCAVGDPECCDSHTFATPDCSCHIFDLFAEVGHCTSDTSYILHVLFDFDNLPTDSVLITANGNLIGQFQVHEGHIILEHLPLYETEHTLLTVCAIGDPECCDTFEFVTPNCDGCHLYELEAIPGDCLSDSTYVLFVQYLAFNLPSDSVVVTANGETIGTFWHDPEGFHIAQFPVFPTNHTVLSICAQDAPDCCSIIEFETPDCVIECEIFELFAEVGECTSDSTFLLDIVFHSEDLPTDSVLIYANGILHGIYFNHPDFIRIEDFPLYPTEHIELTVCAVGAPDCCASYTFATPVCNDSCVISEVSVIVFGCTTDTTFAVVVNFHHQNLSGSGVDIYAGDTYLGFYNFEHIPAEIPHFPVNATGQYVVTICESDNTECCTSFEFEGPSDCFEVCDIYNLEYSIVECDTNTGEFFILLDFDFQFTNDAGFTVVGNGTNYGTFSYEMVPLLLGPFEFNHPAFEFLIFDAENPACFELIVPGIIDSCDMINHIIPVDGTAFFQVMNNGSIPVIYAKQDVWLSLYQVNGRSILFRHPLLSETSYELTTHPAGLYIATIMHGSHIWPVKMVKSGH